MNTQIETVVQLRSKIPVEEQVAIALETLTTTIGSLETVTDSVPVTGRLIDLLDHAECRLALLRMRLKMRKGLVHLTSEMGRPAL